MNCENNQSSFLNGKRHQQQQQQQTTMQGSARTITTPATAAAAAAATTASTVTTRASTTNLDYFAQFTSLNLQHFLAGSIDDQMSSSIVSTQTPNLKNGNCNSVSSVVNPLEEFFAYAVKSDQSETKPSPHLTSLQNQDVKSISNKNETKTKPNVRVPIVAEIRTISGPDGSQLYQCSECNEMFTDKEILSRHIAGHMSDRKYICDVCGAALKRKDHLTRHKQSHNPERPYVCEICQKAFKRKEQLSLHFVIHTGIKKHICSECGRGFYRKDHLRKHTKSHMSRRMKTALMQTPMSSLDFLSSK